MLIKRFLQDRRGNVLPLFAVAIVPVIGLVAAAVDYSRAASTRTELLAALDATALMLSKEPQSVLTDSAKLKAKAAEYFAATFNRPEAKNVVLDPQYTSDAAGLKIKMTGTASVDMGLARLLGETKSTIGSTSEVVWGTKKLELALALDNTGSMASSGKMTELKKATKTLLDTLKTAVKKDGDVKVAIIPFAQEVNVGKTNAGAAWLDWAEWDSENGHEQSTNNCTDKKGKKKKCDTSTTWVPDNHNKWNGCVMDRDQEHDVADTTPSTSVKATLFPAKQAESCPVEMTGLTSQWGTLVSRVESMQPTGTTNVTIGLTWAWHALTDNAPLTEAQPASTEHLDKVIILLTDGNNTENRWSDNQAEIDARTKKVCDNIRNTTKIKVYTVRVIEGNASLLKGCATQPDMFYDVQNASQLNTVFSGIADKLAKLRIAK